MKKKITFIVIVLIFAFLGYNYLYQEHRDIYNEYAQFSVLPNDILKEFKTNSSIAEGKYLNKTIEITGTVTEITETDITINNAVFCNLSTNLETKKIKINTKIIIKGRCIGYDDLLEIVKLDQCNLKK